VAATSAAHPESNPQQAMAIAAYDRFATFDVSLSFDLVSLKLPFLSGLSRSTPPFTPIGGDRIIAPEPLISVDFSARYA
jgi:hypothetical protein